MRCAMKGLLLVLSFVCARIHAEQLIDFEKDMMSEFVLETKKINIPGFLDAFNPSIVPFNGGLLMSFRSREFGSSGTSGESGDTLSDDHDAFLMSFRFRNRDDPACKSDVVSQQAGTNCKNQIGLVLLNQHFEPISWPQILEIRYSSPLVAARQQDPRLLYVGNRLFIVYSNMLNGEKGPELRRMFVAELFYRNETFAAGEPILIDNYEGQDEQKVTKNWVPFASGEKLNLAYNINPHTVFRFDGTNSCQTLGNTSAQIDWDYGTLRGGTPALLDDDGQYLAFFHSSKEMKSAHSEGKKIQHYFMGAYTFSSEPPYSLTSISAAPIIGRNFLNGPAHSTWKPLRVVFPGGIVLGKEKVWVAYGRQDHEVWIATIDKKKLRESMVRVGR
jgi:predicted GH43/DUF377 family glycosyl hydrolase